MNDVVVTLSAIDTLMFRDGRPFNQMDAGAGNAVSLFPPVPPTVVGAIRLYAARQLGFDAGEPWPKQALGDGVDWQTDGRLGPLRFSAPILARYGVSLFPAPLHLMAEGSDCIRFTPSSKAQECDLGPAVYLPAPEADTGERKFKPMDRQWLTLAALKRVLDGESNLKFGSAEHFAHSDLWRPEPRVGIGINAQTRIVVPAQLYAATHTRLADDVAIRIGVRGLAVQLDGGLQALAGEHRMAAIAIATGGLELPEAPKTFPGGRYFTMTLSPLLLDSMPKPGETIQGLPGRLVSACLGRPQRIGGWNTAERRPIAMREAIPAGSVFFMQAGPTEDPGSMHGMHIGTAPEWGFGQIVVGCWSTSTQAQGGRS